MADHTSKPDRREVAEEGESLLRITLAPTVWALHFVASYASAAIYCAKRASGAEDIAVLRIGIGLGTIVALATILWLGHSAWRQWLAAKERSGREMIEDLVEEGEGRHGFLGHAGLLLAIVSFVGVLYTTLPAALIGTCR